ncbi:hypothetical protein F4678DRAFT_478740 [Xylaria arbuscula]|nr:hypothetical protein F4678DRAFT_478740 [Xylaria arbuscula]
MNNDINTLQVNDNDNDNMPPISTYNKRLFKMFSKNIAKLRSEIRDAAEVYRQRSASFTAGPIHVDAYAWDPQDEEDEPATYLNTVEHSNIPTDHVPGNMIEGVVHYYRESNMPVRWNVGPEPNPLLEAALLSHGFKNTAHQPLLFRDLESFRSNLLPVDREALVEQKRMDLLCGRITRLAQRERQRALRCVNEQTEREARRMAQDRAGRIRARNAEGIRQLTVRPVKGTIVGDYVIEQIDLDDDVASWVGGLHPPMVNGMLPSLESLEEIYTEVLEEMGVTKLRLFAARVRQPDAQGHQDIVGIGLIHVRNGIALLHELNVNPQYSSCRLQLELLQFGMRLALHMGADKAIALPRSRIANSFRLLGFREIGQVKEYCLSPKRNRRVIPRRKR